MAWTSDEIRDLYKRNERQPQSVLPHSDETLAHRLISIFEGWCYFENMITDPETHKEFEEIIRRSREGHGERMYGLNEDKVDSNPQAAKERVMVYILNRIEEMCK